MKTQFYTDGVGGHRVTLEAENQIEKVMIEAMSLYPCEISACKLNTGPSGEINALQITFDETKVGRHV